MVTSRVLISRPRTSDASGTVAAFTAPRRSASSSALALCVAPRCSPARPSAAMPLLLLRPPRGPCALDKWAACEHSAV
eukprot:3880781-Pleurochrysis_carterae.AAC.1